MTDDDLGTLIGKIQEQLTDRTEDAILRILTGALCFCGESASHIELGPINMQYDSDTFTAQVIRTARYRCAEHWSFGADVTVAEVAWPPTGGGEQETG